MKLIKLLYKFSLTPENYGKVGTTIDDLHYYSLYRILHNPMRKIAVAINGRKT